MYHSVHQDEHEEGHESLKLRHSCTDVPCCIIFLLTMVAFGGVYGFALQQTKGSIGRLFHGIDSDGLVCGVDRGVEEKPLLFWCAGARSAQGASVTSLSLSRRVCVESCPGSVGDKVQDCASDDTGDDTVTLDGYPTKVLLHRYCMPDLDEYRGAAAEAISSQLGGYDERAAEVVSSIPAAWPALIGALVLAIALGYAHLFLLRCCAEVFIWISIALSVLGLGALGAFLWLSAGSETLESRLPERLQLSASASLSPDEEKGYRIAAIVCWALSFAALCMACCLRSSIDAAAACVEVACESIFEMPTLLLAPAIKAISKGLLSVGLLYGFLLLWSMGPTSDYGSPLSTAVSAAAGALNTTAVDLPDITSAFDATARALSTTAADLPNITQAVNATAGALSTRAADLPDITQAVNATAGALSARGVDVPDIPQAVNATAGALSARGVDVPDIPQAVNATAGALSARGVDVPDIAQAVNATAGALSARGVDVPHITHTQLQTFLLIFYMFAAFWILAFVNALYQFVVAYTVATFYYAPHEQDEDGNLIDEKDVEGCCTALEGFHVGIVYHAGSLAFGAALIAILRTIQKVIEYAQLKNKEAGDNKVVACVLCICGCCVKCLKDIVGFINKNAYIDMAITSNSFCTAARRALQMVIELGGAMAILNGATYVFSIFGTIFITVACTAATYAAASYPPFADQSSTFYVESPLGAAIVAAGVSFLVALSFMDVFDMASDTLLYCYGVDKQSGKEDHTAPRALQELVDHHEEANGHHGPGE